MMVSQKWFSVSQLRPFTSSRLYELAKNIREVENLVHVMLTTLPLFPSEDTSFLLVLLLTV